MQGNLGLKWTPIPSQLYRIHEHHEFVFSGTISLLEQKLHGVENTIRHCGILNEKHYESMANTCNDATFSACVDLIPVKLAEE